ncbi:MAG: virulence RhuM family protein [Spirochaetaceae bacterium]|nr:virulence RhuM family protein [Spirochaetaceae bacterium]
METTANDGKNYKTKFYNLDTIIAVGYRVNSKRAIHFRIWATNILKEYIIKGFAMDDERLKQTDNRNYFDEWLERIRDIRASEKRFYQKIRDIYATLLITIKPANRRKYFLKRCRIKCSGLLSWMHFWNLMNRNCLLMLER